MVKATDFENGPPSKRRKADGDTSSGKGLDRPISPPLSRRNGTARATTSTPTRSFDNVPKQTSTKRTSDLNILSKQSSKTPPSLTKSKVEESTAPEIESAANARFVRSPIRLTKIKDLELHQNVDTISLNEILGDPMIKECWNFNFLFDLDFVMEQFDQDVRDLVKVKIVHGFWKQEDPRRAHLVEMARQYPQIELLNAYLPDAFGTHHSKMLIFFRHDDLAQIVIHTANMIPRDWGNMTQAVWRSPLLPLLTSTSASSSTRHTIGTGQRFKVDLIRYIDTYERRLRRLSAELAKYDFSSIRAAFIGSAPSKQKPSTINPENCTSFGWVGLQEILSSIPVSSSDSLRAMPHIITQISSIATSTPAWHSYFQSILSRHSASQDSTTASSSSSSPNFFGKRESVHSKKPPKPKFNIIFPTPAEIRTSLDGYDSGDSIHMKLQSAQQQKQLEFLHSLLCHWNDSTSSPPNPSSKEAHRGPAAPHIKTYIRFSDDQHKMIDWAMVTSANLSTQAWGALPNKNKNDEVWIQSYETGVIVWPALFNDAVDADPSLDTGKVVMVPVFGKDWPDESGVLNERDTRDEDEKKEKGSIEANKDEGKGKAGIIVGFRMPYNLPLSKYAATDKPWCASSSYEQPDWKGRYWG